MPNGKREKRAEAKRQRVAKACDYCRSKKVRCDGEQPCNNCISCKTSCTYNHVKKRRTTDKKSSPKRSKEVDDRLERLELMIESLVTQLGSSNSVVPVSRIQHNEETTDDDESDSTQAENDAHLQPSTNKKTDQKELNGLSREVTPFSSNGKTSCSDATLQFAHRKTECFDSFFAEYCSFSLFSKEGQEWLVSKMKSEHLEIINKNLRHMFANYVSYSFTLWIEPIQPSDLQPLFPKNISLGLLKFLFSYVSQSLYPIDTNEQLALLEVYCESQGRGKGKSHHLSYANLMMLNMFLAFSLALYRDSVLKTSVRIEGLDISPEKSREYESGFLRNTIFYYQRLFLVGDGLNSILAILLLYKYCEGTLAFHAAYMLLSTGVRLAQEMGLHRAESYAGLSQKEQDSRAIIWWDCYTEDKLYSIKSGKPSIINDLDVSAPLPSYWRKLVVLPHKVDEFRRAIDEEYGPGLAIPEYIRINALNTSYNKGKAAVLHYFLSLSFLVSYIYQTVFSVSTTNHRSLEEQMIQFEVINEKLEQWRLSLPEQCRPKSRKELNNEDIYKNLTVEGVERVLHEQNKYSTSSVINPFEIDGPTESVHFRLLLKDLHLAYYTILSSVCKVFIDKSSKLVSANHSHSRVVGEYVAMRVNSCREVLFMSKEVGEGTTFFANIFSFYLLAAFIPLFCNILRNPDSETTAFDFALLYYSEKHYFERLEGPHTAEPTLSRHPLSLLTAFFLLVAHNLTKRSSNFASISTKFDEFERKNFDIFKTIGLTSYSQSKSNKLSSKSDPSLTVSASEDFHQDLTSRLDFKQDNKITSDSVTFEASRDNYLPTYTKDSLINGHSLYREPNFASQIVPPIMPPDTLLQHEESNLADANFQSIHPMVNSTESAYIPIEYQNQPGISENSKLVNDLNHESFLQDDSADERACLFQTVFDVPGFYLDS
ncbi:Putative transcription factor [Komagataella phaffii CBS 7435]|uniref:Transcription factor containing a zinc finger n=2 Tax=Komagataella phaffii TaxID=460519 RepID=C4R4H0_KOMPG|nr:Putative transcription factor containing a zinc finger [Komagataella phaffii GS115]AOA63686.1 GQ67_03476T0 [Komagataella phaffii]CAH2449789.1 Putative transcription factor [Komagataella phaffii CBS 7435]AOA69068.1 GQ68_03446T0 [Komagataella phaffii GS115]CAY70456.1 Putative transcription factor containing a zinc finger [Komagataella phaffii GS115]CCA39759.1 Putative transcription factor [Komagataella phaffii CBS 7435]